MKVLHECLSVFDIACIDHGKLAVLFKKESIALPDIEHADNELVSRFGRRLCSACCRRFR